MSNLRVTCPRRWYLTISGLTAHGTLHLVTCDVTSPLIMCHSSDHFYTLFSRAAMFAALDNVSPLGSFLHAFQSCSNISRMIPIRPVCYKFSIVHVKNTDLVCLSELFTQVLDIRALRRLSPTSKCLTRLDHVYFVGL